MRRAAPFFSIAFAVFSLLWLGLSHLLLPVTEGQKDYSLMIANPYWEMISSFGFLAAVTGLFAAFGLYLQLREKRGVLAFPAFVFLALGLKMELTTLSWDLFIWPVIMKHHAAFIRDGIFVQTPHFQIAIMALLAFLLLGNILLAISLWKTKIFPSWIPVALLCGILLYVAGNLLHIYVASAGLFFYCAGFIGIGLRQFALSRLVRENRESPA